MRLYTRVRVQTLLRTRGRSFDDRDVRKARGGRASGSFNRREFDSYIPHSQNVDERRCSAVQLSLVWSGLVAVDVAEQTAHLLTISTQLRRQSFLLLQLHYVDFLWICCTACCAGCSNRKIEYVQTNRQQIEVMEFEHYAVSVGLRR